MTQATLPNVLKLEKRSTIDGSRRLAPGATSIAGKYAVDNFVLPPDVRSEIEAELDKQFDAQITAGSAKIAKDKTRRDAKRSGAEVASVASDDVLAWYQPLPLFGPTPASSHETAYRVFNRPEIEAQFASCLLNLRSAEERDAKRLRTICVDLAKRGEYRHIGILQPGWRAKLVDLMKRFPNFKRVVTYVIAMFLLQEENAQSTYPFPMPRLHPILLDGPPGIGKSTFVQALAECFALPFYRFDLGSMQTGGVLTGSDEMWSNSKTGKVFQTFSEQGYANPFFMLDELDKMPRSQHFDAEGALLTLLEPSTAKTFHDMSVPALSLDVSYATWIGTCNEQRAISEPILSRFRVFKIPAIGKDHVEAFTLRMLDEVAEELGVHNVKYTLKPEAVQLLTKLPPRAMRRAMRECIAYACMLRKSTISDKLVEQAVEDPAVFRDGSRRVGF